MNPVWMYNQNKPDKYQVELFVLANCSGGFHFVVHLDVFQGKNKANIGIAKEIFHLPTTQKALVNSVLQSKLHNKPNGYKVIFSDNCYTCAEVAVLFGVMDFMTNQGEIGWKMSALDLSSKCNKVSTAHFQISLFANMIHFVDQSKGNYLTLMQISLKENGHIQQPTNQKLRPICCICKLKRTVKM